MIGVRVLTSLDLFLNDFLRVPPGDVDLTGKVGFADFLVLSQHFGEPGGWAQGDFNGDSTVDFADFLTLSANFKSSARAVAVPEPSSNHLLLWSLLFATTWMRRCVSRSYAVCGQRF